MLQEREEPMAKRRRFDDQGSMLVLMEHHTVPARLVAEPAITREIRDADDNVVEMHHEPVQDPLDDADELEEFIRHYNCAQRW